MIDALVERESQLAALHEQFAGVVRSSHGRVVVIGGEAGVGKTSLVRRFCAEAGPNVRVVTGGCSTLHTVRPLGPFYEIADDSPPVSVALADGGRAHEVAAALVGDIPRGGALVVVLEDLHWADEATLDVLRLVARRVETRPVLVLVTVRDDELDREHPFRLLLGDMPSLARIHLAPFTPAAVEALASRTGVDGKELYRKTAGNPFFVTEALASAAAEIPETVRDAVLARAARLGPERRTVLEAIAATPPQTELWLLERLVPDALVLLDGCVASGMVVAGRESVGFRHELARIAIEDSLTVSRRIELHRAALAALEATSGTAPDLARLTYHAEAGASIEALLRYAPAAAEQAASLGAHREAERHYAAALRHADRLPPDERAAMLEAHAQECYLVDRSAEAVASGRAAAQTFRELGQPLREADSLLKLSSIQRMTGHIKDSMQSVEAAAALLEGQPPARELALGYAALSLAGMLAMDGPTMVSAGERARELAASLGEPEVEAHVLATIGTFEMEYAETRGAGRDKLLQAIRIGREHGFERIVGRAYNNLVYECFAYHDLASAEQAIVEFVDYSTERGLDLWLHWALGCRAELELVHCHWDAAVETAQSVLRATTMATSRLTPLIVVALIRARRGDPDAWGPLDEALSISRPTGELQMLLPVAVGRAEVAWLEGRDARVLEETDQVVSLARRAHDDWALRDTLYWRWKAGEVSKPLSTDESPRRDEIAGRPTQAAERWASLGYRYQAAIALGESDDPHDLRRALDELQEIGARVPASIVARRLREKGVRGVPRGPRASTAANPGGLTAREVDVLKLVSEGLRDAEIAERLFLSEKTVGHHVSAILRKLGVSSRGQAAAEAGRLGLTD